MNRLSTYSGIFLALLFIVLGLIFGNMIGVPLAGAGFGALAALLLLLFRRYLEILSPWTVLGGFLGVLAVAVALGVLRGDGPPVEPNVPAGVFLLAFLLSAGGLAGARAARAFSPAGTAKGSGETFLLDTSSLIDGRIVELVREEFLDGTILIPRFVLLEAQTVADSPDPIRRARGRRGLSAAEQLQALQTGKTLVIPDDCATETEVDAKLTALARAKGAKLVTTDFNLAKVAQLQGVKVLNIHGLAQAMRPVYAQGERLRVTVQKPGKEAGQGIGYLEDGTMVVIDGGQAHMDRAVEAIVTSVLQTSAGRMVFARLADETGERA